MTLEKWFKSIGCVVDVIYMSKKGRFTKRRIRIISVRNGYVRAFCISSGAQRVFLIENMLAAELVRSNVS